MSNYKPGTVALVTFEGAQHHAIHDGMGWNLVTPQDDPPRFRIRWVNESLLENVTPVVCIQATRKDADDLALLAGYNVTPSGSNVARRVAHAICEQYPEPLVIPENLGAVVEGRNGLLWVYGPHGPGWWCARKDVAQKTTAQMREIAVRILSEGIKP